MLIALVIWFIGIKPVNDEYVNIINVFHGGESGENPELEPSSRISLPVQKEHPDFAQ